MTLSLPRRPSASSLACGSVLALVLSVAQGAPPTSNVNVVNQPNVQVTNEPNVQVTNEPNVRVVNEPEVRDADHPVRHAFQQRLCTVGWPPGCGSSPSQFTVPEDKRLVIEYVSAQCNANNFADTLSIVSVQTVVSGVPASHRLIPVFMGNSNSFRHYVAAQQMRAYADPGTPVTGSAGGFPATGSMGCLMTVSGTLIDL